MQRIKQMIKEHDFNRVILLYGEELFLLNFYLKKLVEAMLDGGEATMNYDVFSDKKITIDTLEDSINTLPFFSDNRVVVISHTGLFEKKRADFAAKFTEVIKNVPDTTYVIIVESSCDKRTKLYKGIKKIGSISEFGYLNEGDLVKYVAKSLNKYDKKISGQDARYLINYVSNELTVLSNELEKLSNYMGPMDIVTKADIDAICQKSVENKIFELVDCMGTKKRGRALKLYHDLLASKEPSNKILFMITRQFRINHKAKLLQGEGLNLNGISSRLKMQSFIIRKCLEQNKGFSIAALEGALEECLLAEIDIRTGVFAPDLAVEQLIIKYSG